MNTAAKPSVSKEQVLSKALVNAAKGLGVSQTDVGAIIGRDRTSLARGLDPASKPGQLAALFIRCYRSLYALFGGSELDMRHWMQTPNRHIGGVPVELMLRPDGLCRTVDYLDAIRGKV